MSNLNVEQIQAEALRTNKRSVFVDPDTGEILTDAKRPRIQLDVQKKVACIKAMIEGYVRFLTAFFGEERIAATEGAVPVINALRVAGHKCVNVSIQISNLIFTMHTICRQKALGKTGTNTQEKAATSEFTVTYRGTHYHSTLQTLEAAWRTSVGHVGLAYGNYNQGDPQNWYGTFGPYIDFFCAFGLRYKELRLGHDKMPITKTGGISADFPVKKYGLTGAHHVLLEGCTYPPEKRSSMAQSVGPMTAFLCMLKSDGDYRRKWAAAVKRAFNHIPVIDEIIEVTKTQKRASDVATMITLLAEIVLITTTRQATRMCFPLNMMYDAIGAIEETQRDAFIANFNTSGSGGYVIYKSASTKMAAGSYTLECLMTQEKAGQAVFHSIFGSFKEDLSILAQISDTNTWYTREQFGKSFKKPEGTVAVPVNVKLPKLTYYSKLSSANQTGLLSGVYTQVSAIPVFSGARVQMFGQDFFEHIQKRVTSGPVSKSIPQINGSLSVILEELHDKLKKGKGKLEMGTVQWRSMANLASGVVGDPVPELKLMAIGKYFMGRSDTDI